jgi:hypothetical protein
MSAHGAAKVRAAKYQRTDAAALLSPRPDNRDDTLALNYLGHRLGVQPERVPRPATNVVGIKSLAYFDKSRRPGDKPVRVGDFPAAVFETVDPDGKRHAHRIYLAPGGAGKADLGVAADGQRRKAKKSAKKTKNDNTDGRAVIWGDPLKAETELIFEGVEQAAAAALAFETEIASGEMVIGGCFTASDIEAFKPWPPCKRVIIGADRDEACNAGLPASPRGELAARKFASMHHSEIDVSIALPGKSGEKIDWVDLLQRDGVKAMRNGILAAEQFLPSGGPAASEPTDQAEITRLSRLPPLSYDRERDAAAARLGCRVATLDEQVKVARRQSAITQGQGRPIGLPETEPWHVTVDGAALLTALSNKILEYVILSDVQADAVAL